MMPCSPPVGEFGVPNRDEWSGDDPDQHRTENRVFPEPSAKGSHTTWWHIRNLQVNEEPEPE